MWRMWHGSLIRVVSLPGIRIGRILVEDAGYNLPAKAVPNWYF
jgi:hypothetical protein